MVLLLPGSGDFSTAGQCKQQGCSGELGGEALGDSGAWHFDEHQDDETEEEAKGEEVLFSERE